MERSKQMMPTTQTIDRLRSITGAIDGTRLTTTGRPSVSSSENRDSTVAESTANGAWTCGQRPCNAHCSSCFLHLACYICQDVRQNTLPRANKEQQDMAGQTDLHVGRALRQHHLQRVLTRHHVLDFRRERDGEQVSAAVAAAAALDLAIGETVKLPAPSPPPDRNADQSESRVCSRWVCRQWPRWTLSRTVARLRLWPV